jgi:WD40 repeat protein
VAISLDGNYVATSGNDQDTLIQFYDVKSGNIIGNIDTNEIKNVEMKMTPDDRCLTVSTFMREIAIIEYKKSEKFNKVTGSYEVSMTLQRNKSIGGIKVPINSYDFSNDDKFFVVSCENKKIKIFQNYGHIEDSKLFSEFTSLTGLEGDRASLYVTSFHGGKLTGYVAISTEGNIYIYDCEGNLLKIINNAHDSKISLLKFAYDQERSGPVLISASKDARFFIWNIN